MAVTGNLCRVTIVAPNTRMDVALPDHVQLCELQSDLLQHVADGPGGDDLVETGAASGGWSLTRLGGAPLDGDLTPRQLDIVDGEELYFQPLDEVAPEIVFDDIIDAMATANEQRPGKWDTSESRAFGTIVAAIALLSGAVATFYSGGSSAMWLAYGLALGILAAGITASRALGQHSAGAVLGLMSLPYAFVAGLLTLGPVDTISAITAPELMVGSAVMVAFAVVAGIGVPTAAPLFSAAAITGAATLIGAILCTFAGATSAESAATVAMIILVFIPAMPMLSFRVARLPMPTVPRSPQQLRADNETVNAKLALYRSERADQHLTGMLAAAAFVTTGAVFALAMADGFPATALAVLLSILMFMRARIFVTVRQRVPFLIAAVAGGASLALSDWLDATPSDHYTVWVATVVIVGVLAVGWVLGIAGKRISPIWGRMIDIFEVIFFIAAIPLTLWVWDAYWWVRTVNG